MMSVVSKVSKILSPRGMMPNPKAGTVAVDIAQIIKKFKGEKATEVVREEMLKETVMATDKTETMNRRYQRKTRCSSRRNSSGFNRFIRQCDEFLYSETQQVLPTED